MQTGQNEKTRVSYFSVLKNISKIQSNQRPGTNYSYELWRVIQPLNIEAGQNKETRISYFSVLKNISKIQSNRRRTPGNISLLEVIGLKSITILLYTYNMFIQTNPSHHETRP